MIDTAGYGKALFELSSENGTDETVRGELELVREALRRQPEYVTLLDTPAVAVEATPSREPGSRKALIMAP